MSRYLNLRTFPLLILVSVLTPIFFFDPSNPALSRDSSVFTFFVWICCIGINLVQKRSSIHPLFLLVCLLLIGLSTINGINRAPVVYFPQKVNLKLMYVASLAFAIFLFFKNVPPIFLFIHSVAFACSPPLFSSIKSIPLLLFVLAAVPYLIRKRFRWNRLHASIAAFLSVVCISSLLSYKSQSAWMQFCLLMSAVTILFLLSGFPGRALKKGMLLILSFNLLLNMLNLLSAVHTLYPFDPLHPPFLLTYAGFPVSAIAVISAFTALTALYTGLQFKRYSWILFPGAAGASYLVFFSQSRASMLALGIGLAVLVLAFRGKRAFTIRIAAIGISAFVSIAILGYLFLPEEELRKYFDPNTLFIRFSLWTFHFQSVAHNAPFFGLGPDADSLLAHLPGVNADRIGYRDFYDFLHSFRSYPQAHNLYMETFTSLGFSGFLLFLWIALYLAKTAFGMFSSKNRTTSDSAGLVFATLAFMAVHEFFDFNTGEQHFLIPATIALSLIDMGSVRKISVMRLNRHSVSVIYFVFAAALYFLSFQLIWEQRLRNLILVSTQNEIELDNFLVYKQTKKKQSSKKRENPLWANAIV
ncbi:O-antigen ligase family protein [Leptospira ellisii]|uniref:O-antigen ligase family protein n=1 Tax=Leptospira ellisii TaxID=2023197 RepID=UPI000C2A2193|nr:O-antigen ligase family protein [Leptospira ellisii]PKA04240.1 ligase [Leptospira ellisii]